MAKLKPMKIEENVKEDLDSIKYYANESYTSVIKRVIEENKQLKEDKKQLYKIILCSEDPVNLITNVHKATYFIIQVLEDKATTEEDKLEVLEHYLQEMLKHDPTSILDSIEIIKDRVEDVPEVLVKFENFVKTSS